MSDSQPAVPPGGEVRQLRYNLDSLDEYLETAKKVADNGRIDEAHELLREAAQQYPESALAHFNLAVAIFLKLREDLAHLELWEDLTDDEQLAEECLVELQQAIERDPAMVQAHNYLARVLALRGRREDAIATWQKSLALNPNQPEVQSELDIYQNKLSEPPDIT